MRLNIYSEELTTEQSVIVKKIHHEPDGEATFYGLRFYLKSPPELSSTKEDDDRSAVTFWVAAPTSENDVGIDALANMFGAAETNLAELSVSLSDQAREPESSMDSPEGKE